MKEWRPKNWNDIVEKSCPVMEQYDPDPMIADNAFEAGADAMLEALRATHSLEGFEKMTEVILKPNVTEPVSV